MFANFFNRNKTFKPLKSHKQGSKAASLHDYAKATLGTGDVHAAVTTPAGEDESEWLATNVTDFYNTVSLVYGTIADYCTPETCPTMSAGPRYEYLWADGVTVMKPTRCSAPEYIDRLLTWVDAQLRDESLFPVAPDKPFPRNFKMGVVSPIMKRLARVFSHLYYHHFDSVLELGADKHLNTAFKHFAYFVLHFGLVEPKELAPMSELIDTLTNNKFNVTALSGGSGTLQAAPTAAGAPGAAAGGPPQPVAGGGQQPTMVAGPGQGAPSTSAHGAARGQ